MVDRVMSLNAGTRLLLMAPVIQDRKGENQQLFNTLQSQGFVRVRIDGVVYEMDEIPSLDKKRKHTIEVVVDRVIVGPQSAQRLAESFETALALTDGLALVQVLPDDEHTEGESHLFSALFACPHLWDATAENICCVPSRNSTAARRTADPDHWDESDCISYHRCLVVLCGL